MGDHSYVLITAAKNEEAYIERVLQSVVAQTRLPRIWVIVSDGSTDRTDELVSEFAARNDFIRLLKLPNNTSRAFSSQAFACNVGYNTIRQTEFDFVGFLDADLSFEADYYEKLLACFDASPRLGVAGGDIFEYQSGQFRQRHFNAEHNVAGAIQLFRRQCFEDIGQQFIPLRYGGHDFVANAMASRKGWDVRSVADLHVFHHRTTGSAAMNVCRIRFETGMQDYFLGYQPLFEIGKCIRRIAHPPLGLGAVLQACGYFFPWLTGQRMTLPADYVRYLRQEQLHRLFGRAQPGVSGSTFRRSA